MYLVEMQPISSEIVIKSTRPRLLTAEARLRSQVKSRGVCGGQSGARIGFVQLFRFPLPIIIPPTAPSTLYSLYIASLNIQLKKIHASFVDAHRVDTKH
jgi:hypothetical protein